MLNDSSKNTEGTNLRNLARGSRDQWAAVHAVGTRTQGHRCLQEIVGYTALFSSAALALLVSAENQDLNGMRTGLMTLATLVAVPSLGSWLRGKYLEIFSLKRLRDTSQMYPGQIKFVFDNVRRAAPSLATLATEVERNIRDAERT